MMDQPPCPRPEGEPNNHAKKSHASDPSGRNPAQGFSLSSDTALRLARYFGVSPEFWLDLQKADELRTAQPCFHSLRSCSFAKSTLSFHRRHQGFRHFGRPFYPDGITIRRTRSSRSTRPVHTMPPKIMGKSTLNAPEPARTCVATAPPR